MERRVTRDIPLAEVTIRKYEKPDAYSDRDLVRRFCLSLGLLQPGDSRDVIIDILYVFLSTREPLTTEEVMQMVISLRQEEGLPLQGVAMSNIRRQLKRLRDMQLIEKIGTQYRITEDLSLQEIYRERILPFLIQPILQRIEAYFTRLDEEFPDPYKQQDDLPEDDSSSKDDMVNMEEA